MESDTSEGPIPQPPEFTDEELQRCKESGDYRPVLFEWYRFVGSLKVVAAYVQPDAPSCEASISLVEPRQEVLYLVDAISTPFKGGRLMRSCR